MCSTRTAPRPAASCRSACIRSWSAIRTGAKYFAKALHHITSRQDVWLTTGSAIVDWYKENYLNT
jgi:hypothetical protein